MKDLLAPTPSVRQPLFETSDSGGSAGRENPCQRHPQQAEICVKLSDLLRPVQNTKPLGSPKYTPKCAPNRFPKPKYEKNTKTPDLCRFFVFFSYFGFGRGFGVYFGVCFGDQRGFVFCMGRRRSQVKVPVFRTVFVSDFSSRPWRNLPPTWVIHMVARRPAHNTPIHMDLVLLFIKKSIQEVHVDRCVVGWSAGRHVIFRFGHPNPGKCSTRIIFHQKLHGNSTTPLVEKSGEILFTRHFCRV